MLRAIPPLLLAGAVLVVGFSILGPESSTLSDSEEAMSSRHAPSDPIPPADPSSTEDPAVRMEYLGVPAGVYDPVLKWPAANARFEPPANTVVNDRAGNPLGSVQSEVSMFVAGDTIVVGWNDSEGFSSPDTSISGWGYSIDRGDTWTDGGSLARTLSIEPGGDPSVVRTNAGTWIMTALDLGDSLGLAIHRGSTAGGVLTWSPPFHYSSGGAFIDKEYLEYDVENEIVYLAYITSTNFELTRSTDDGLTWDEPLTVAPRTTGNGCYPVVGIDGEVYVTWVQPISFTVPSIMSVRHSADGGQTFSGPANEITQLLPESIQPPACFNRPLTPPWGSFDVDRSDGPYRGRLYGVWGVGATNQRNAVLSYSDDKGVTWSSPVVLNDNDNASTTESFWPSIRVSETDGRIFVGFYDRRNSSGNSLCDFYGTMSVDGGTSWGMNRRLSDTSVAWCGVPVEATPNFGDYVDVAIDSLSVFAVWSDAREGDPDVVFSRFDDRHELEVAGSIGDSLDFGGFGTAWFFPNEAEIELSPSPEPTSQTHMSMAAIAMAAFASPEEEDGVFKVGGDSLSADLELTSSHGDMSGGFSIYRTGAGAIDLVFEVVADSSLDSLGLDVWTSSLRVDDAGPGRASLGGVVTFGQGLDMVRFTLNGMIQLEGAPETFFGRLHRFTQTAQLTDDGDLRLHTWTHVTAGAAVDVPDMPELTLGGNPFPLVSVALSPNPLQPDSRIQYSTDRDLAGRISIYAADGRRVRTVLEGDFPAGDGHLEFDGRDDRGRQLAQGLYFVRLENETLAVTRKFIVLR